MHVPALLWFATAGILLALIARDLASGWRARPEPSPRADALAVGGYLLLAALFGAAVLAVGDARSAGAFFAGWGSSLAVTVDALVVFVLITSGARDRHRVVVLGVAASALARCGLIAFGIPGASASAWISALFGACVLAAAWPVFRHDDAATLPAVLGRPGAAPAAAVLAAVVLALFSVSAAVTGGAYLAFCAGMFSLLGFHRLFRLVAGLVDRIPDASAGLAVVLVFIGVKSVLAGVTGTGPDAQVTVLTLGMIAVVAALSAITAARAPSP
ncbi:TerC family protein [Saccharopolyspora sp. NPDC003752]